MKKVSVHFVECLRIYEFLLIKVAVTAYKTCFFNEMFFDFGKLANVEQEVIRKFEEF